ncbi:MAG: ABC transporter substrate-binding protein [Lautropia sp.]|nr:ABC transporter substrate-binding protein [Lautropia sp.]
MLLAGALFTSALFVVPVSTPASADEAAPECEVDHPVRFGGMNWESNLVLTEVERRIIEAGYGCKTEVLPTETLPALAALERGDLDINTEIWQNSIAEPWAKALASGKVKSIGNVFTGFEGWYIPRYTADELPDLKKISDLPRFKEDFADPEDPSKGRFYGCPAGWGCEVVISQIFKAEKTLAEAFNMYSPGTGAAQKAAIMTAYKRKRPVVFYYWGPTPLVGSTELVKLEFPPYDEKKHQCLTDANCANPEVVGYPENPVLTGANSQFVKRAPNLVEFLGKVNVPTEVLNTTLAQMEENDLEPAETADWFLKNHQDVWSQWVPEDVAGRVESNL